MVGIFDSVDELEPDRSTSQPPYTGASRKPSGCRAPRANERSSWRREPGEGAGFVQGLVGCQGRLELTSASNARTLASVPSAASASAVSAHPSIWCQIGTDREHRGPDRRLKSEEGVGVRPSRHVSGGRRAHSSASTRARRVVARAHGLAEHPEEALARDRRRELDGARQELDGLVQLVASSGKLAGASRPGDRAPTIGRAPPASPRPDEIRILGIDRLGVVVREKGCSLVVAVLAGPSHSASAACRRPRCAFGIVPYATSRVSACLNAYSRSQGERRVRRGDDQVPLLEEIEDRRLRRRGDEHGPPEDTPDHGGCLERGLLEWRSRSMRAASTAWTVSGMENRLGTSRDDQPPRADERATVDEISDELLQEERVALGSLHDEGREDRRKLDGRSTRRATARRRLGQRELEPDDGRVSPSGSPGRAPVEQLRPSSGKRRIGRPSIREDPLERIEEVLLGPVDVLDEERPGRRRVRAPRRTHDRRVQLSRASRG